MKLAIWTRYSDLGASSRLRFRQFVPYLQDSGIDIEYHSFFDDGYLQRMYSGKRRQLVSVLKSYCRRFRELAKCPAGVPALIEYELLPHLPYFFEAGFLRRHPYILNFDDAVDLHYEKIRWLKNKYPQLIADAAGVIAANELLAEKFGRYNSNVLKLPTIPPENIRPGENKPKRLTLVWTGTPVTYKFLAERAGALQMAAAKTDFQLLIVASAALPGIPGVDCRCINWSPEAEAAALAEAHAGLMPLPDTPFARGKSAYKLICYLRAGIPGIASPVGENCRVIKEGENGLFAGSDEQWSSAIAKLAEPEIFSVLSRGALSSGRAYLPACAADFLEQFIRQSLLQK
ncbi:MAG: glycosyltransferase family 4 protein [Lentisphaerae bacterium]|nr:glycosyltransferase family 4 protein [Lentisphaerota bacterium]